MKFKPDDKFQKGDRVRLTAQGIKYGFGRIASPPYTKGVVIGRGHRGTFRVLPNGHISSATYHPDFWELDEESK